MGEDTPAVPPHIAAHATALADALIGLLAPYMTDTEHAILRQRIEMLRTR